MLNASIAINTISAVIIKSISLANSLQYNTHLRDRFSNLSIFNLLIVGARIPGVTRSSTSDLTISLTFTHTNIPIAIPIILYFVIKSINSCSIDSL